MTILYLIVLKNIEVPENIELMRIPHYTPKPNPCEQVWKYIKNKYKNETFESLDKLKDWLISFVNKMTNETIKSIVSTSIPKYFLYELINTKLC